MMNEGFKRIPHRQLGLRYDYLTRDHTTQRPASKVMDLFTK